MTRSLIEILMRKKEVVLPHDITIEHCGVCDQRYCPGCTSKCLVCGADHGVEIAS